MIKMSSACLVIQLMYRLVHPDFFVFLYKWIFLYRITLSRWNKQYSNLNHFCLQTAFARVHAISLVIALSCMMIVHADTLDGIRTSGPLAKMTFVSATQKPTLHFCDLGSKFMPGWVTTLLCGRKMQHGAARMMQEGWSLPVILVSAMYELDRK